MLDTAQISPATAAFTREVDVALRDGSTVHVRPACPADHAAMRTFLEGLSSQSRWFRFFTAAVNLETMAHLAVDRGHGLSLLAVTGTDGHIVGHGHYIPDDAGATAEVAFAVADEWQGHGIATLLLAHLADAAVAAGIPMFTATVLPANRRMIDVMRESGFPVDVRAGSGTLSVTLPTSLSAEGRERFADRERQAAAAAVAHVLRPSSLVVVGASRRRGTVGGELVHNLVTAGFRGRLYPVNPRGGVVAGIPAWRSITEVPGPIETAVIAVPAVEVPDAARACAALGVRALVVVSSGFAEVGEAGRRLQRELMDVCRTSGMRVVGPNCLGVLNTDPATSLNATFAPGTPTRGRVAFASQSGAFGIAAIDMAARRGIGLSSFVSAGDKADLSGNDFIEYWEDDPDTDVILLYLESFGNPRNFGRIARRVTAVKPIVAVKSGRTPAGHRAAASHTGALLAASDTNVDALFRHAGVIRTDTIGEMFDVACVLERSPLPAGDRVAIVTNAGGPGILCTDACDVNGLRIATLSDDTRRRLSAQLPAHASVANPVDMVASATAEDYERTLTTVLDDPDVDAVIAIFVRPLATRAADVAAVLRRVVGPAADPRVPVLAVFMGADDPGDAGVPQFTSAEEAVRALGHAVRHAQRRAMPDDPPPELAGIDTDRAASVIATALGRGGAGWLEPEEVDALLGCYGIRLMRCRRVASAWAAGRAAAELGSRVALKAIAPGLLHKSDVGAVRLGLRGAAEVHREARAMSAHLRATGVTVSGFLVQEMAGAGVELLVGVVGDPRFGPLIAVGAGGTTAELIGDVQVRLAPLGRNEAAAMLRELRTFPLLDGFRGGPRADIAAVEDVLVRVAALAAAHPAVAELDCNPVVAGPEGARVVDARVRVEPPPAERPFGAVAA